MPSNNGPKTTYLNLPLYNANDSTTTFVDFWQSINANADGTILPSSAFQLIDAAYHDLDLRIQALPDQIKSEIADLLDEAMEDNY